MANYQREHNKYLEISSDTPLRPLAKAVIFVVAAAWIAGGGYTLGRTVLISKQEPQVPEAEYSMMGDVSGVAVGQQSGAVTAVSMLDPFFGAQEVGMSQVSTIEVRQAAPQIQTVTQAAPEAAQVIVANTAAPLPARKERPLPWGPFPAPVAPKLVAVASPAYVPASSRGIVLGTSTEGFDLEARLAELQRQIDDVRNNPQTVYVPSFSGPSDVTPVSVDLFALAQDISQFEGIDLIDVAVSGVSGLTDDDIPDTITADNYLPLSGGTVEGDLAINGTFRASSFESYAASVAPYFTATSTDEASTFAGNVGIGTTTPQYLLAVADSSGGTLGSFDSSGGSEEAVVQFKNDLQEWDAGLDNAANGSAWRVFDATSGIVPFAILPVTGNVGIGTTTPYGRLMVWGTDSASTTIISAVNDASTTVFATYGNGNATYAGNIFQSSDERLKTDVQQLDAPSSLSMIEKLNPVSYLRLDQSSSGQQLGFIAQEVQSIFPQLVWMSPPTSLTPDGTFTLNYQGLIAPLVKAVQSLAAKIAGFAESFITKHLSFTKADGDSLQVRQLCVGSVCVSESQFMQVFSGSTSQTAATVSSQAPALSVSALPPVISINGNNPAHIIVGSAYQDLGALITGPTDADKNLGIRLFLDGAEVASVMLDTSASSTHVVEYVATNSYGSATSTRTVFVDGQQPSSSTSTPSVQ